MSDPSSFRLALAGLKTYSRREMSSPTFVILIVCFASIALADDFKTTDGKEYKNVTVSREEPDGITVTNKKVGTPLMER